MLKLAEGSANDAWLGRVGACEAVLQALQRHPESITVISLGLEAIGNLATDEGKVVIYSVEYTSD